MQKGEGGYRVPVCSYRHVGACLLVCVSWSPRRTCARGLCPPALFALGASRVDCNRFWQLSLLYLEQVGRVRRAPLGDVGATMSRSRLSARLARLPHDVLAEVAAQLYEEEPATARRIADAILAVRARPAADLGGQRRPSFTRPYPVFLRIPREQRDCAAASVCQLWLRGWGSTDDVRRGLRAKPCATPDCNIVDICEMAAHPSGTWLCLSMRDHSLRLVDPTMRTFRHLSASSLNISSTEGLLVSDDRIIVGWGEVGPAITCFDFMGARMMEYVEESDGHDAFFDHLALAHNGTLFAAPRWYGGSENEVVAFDSATLGIRFRFKDHLGLRTCGRHGSGW